MQGDIYSLRQSAYQPGLWFVAKAPRVDKQPVVRLSEDSDLPDIALFVEHRHGLLSLYMWMTFWSLELALCYTHC